MLELVLREAVLRREASSTATERRADLEDLVDVADGHVGHIRAAGAASDAVLLYLESISIILTNFLIGSIVASPPCKT